MRCSTPGKKYGKKADDVVIWLSRQTAVQIYEQRMYCLAVFQNGCPAPSDNQNDTIARCI